MAIFLTAAVAIAATRAVCRVGQLCRGPWNPEGPPSSMAIGGPPFLAIFFFRLFFFYFFFVSVIFGNYIKSVLTFNEISMS